MSTAPEDPAAKAHRDELIARRASDWNADIASLQTLQTNIYAVASGSIERTRNSAETVQKSAAAIVTIYTGVLAFVFVAEKSPLPIRGVVAPIFLGAAIVLSTAYLAYVRPPSTDSQKIPMGIEGLEPKSFARLNSFIELTSEVANRRAMLMRASVMALGVGLVSISLPFIQAPGFLADKPPQVTTAEPSPWPQPNLGLPEIHSRILYRAQVEEVLKARESARADAAKKAAAAPPESVLSVAVLVALGALIVALGALPWKRRDKLGSYSEKPDIGSGSRATREQR